MLLAMLGCSQIPLGSDAHCDRHASPTPSSTVSACPTLTASPARGSK